MQLMALLCSIASSVQYCWGQGVWTNAEMQALLVLATMQVFVPRLQTALATHCSAKM